MSKKLSKEEQDYNKVANMAGRMQRDMALKFNVPLHNIIFNAEIMPDGNIEINCIIHRNSKNENNESGIE